MMRFLSSFASRPTRYAGHARFAPRALDRHVAPGTVALVMLIVTRAAFAGTGADQAPAVIHVAPYRPGTTTGQAGITSPSSPTEIRIAPAASLAASESVVVGAPDSSSAEPFRLVAGISLQTQLRDWAKRAGWNLIWNITPDWIIPGPATYSSDFQDATSAVIRDIAAGGADVRADLYTGNNTVVIHEAGNE